MDDGLKMCWKHVVVSHVELLFQKVLVQFEGYFRSEFLKGKISVIF